MTRLSLLLSLFVSALTIAPAMAQEEDKNFSREEAQKTPREETKTSTPLKIKKAPPTPIDTWIAAENAMIDKLSDKDKESIFITRNKHSVIRVIGVVERDVGAAVKSCGKANPDMKATIEARFDQWKEAVNPVIDLAKKSLKSEIEGQKIVKPAELKKVLKLNDEAFEYGDKRTIKSPVSSKEACENLLVSMDTTEDEMVTLLQQTLLPESVIKSRAQREQKAKKGE